MQWDTYAFADKMREKQRKQELAAASGKKKRRLDAEDGEESSRKAKKGKPVQTKAWSHKEDAEARRAARREKKLRKLKAISGAKEGGAEADQDGEAEEDWKEAIREQKLQRRKEKGGGGQKNAGSVQMTGLEL
jgi:ATP-dependent RNA helicase DDX55/SPB4